MIDFLFQTPQSGSTLLHFATRQGHTHIVDWLTKITSIDLNIKDAVRPFKYLFFVVAHTTTLCVFHAKGGRTALIWAINKRYKEIVRILCSCPSLNANIRNKVPDVLHACWNPSPSLPSRSEQNVQDGQTALTLASRFGYFWAITLLTKVKSTDLTVQDEVDCMLANMGTFGP